MVGGYAVKSRIDTVYKWHILGGYAFLRLFEVFSETKKCFFETIF